MSSPSASIALEVKYPPNYPDESPLLEVTHPKDAPKPDQLSFPEDAPHLLASLDEIIHDSLGEAMIFTLISTLKDSAESLIAFRISAIHAEADKAAAQAEEKENAKFHGEAVTKESFLAWRESFFREQREREEEEERRVEESGTRGKKVVKEERKMTGRELWEKGMVGKIDEEAEGEADGERDALAEVEQLTVRD